MQMIYSKCDEDISQATQQKIPHLFHEKVIHYEGNKPFILPF